MEKRICKLCNKSFSNGRALGGHMRSHMVTLQPLPPPPPPPPPAKVHLMIETTCSSSSYSSSEEEDKGLGYGLRENPKKSFRLVDPEFSFAVDAGSVVQDRESETESSKNPSRRRSKRTRKLVFNEEKKVGKYTKLSKVESEPMSSVSDTSPEEDVALCLMMLSRGTWRRKEKVVEEYEYEEEEDDDDDKSIEDSDEQIEMVNIKVGPNRGRGKYQCGTCKKVFKSYQALGGHRASHKKIKPCFTPSSSSHIHEVGSDNAADPRIHECPICFRVFKSGQALGGHKRSHVLGSSTTTTAKHTNSARFGDNLIDLNLPPVDDDDYSQVEVSAVSDAEFV